MKRRGGIRKRWHRLLSICWQICISLLTDRLQQVTRLAKATYAAVIRLRPHQRKFIALFLTTLLFTLNLLPAGSANAQFTWGGANTWNVLPSPPPAFAFPATMPKLNGTATQTFAVSVDSVPYLDIRMTIDDTLVPGGILEGFRDGEPPQTPGAGSPNTGGYGIGNPRRRNLWTRINPATNVGAPGVRLTLEFFYPSTLTPFPINVSGLEIFDIDRSTSINWQDEVVVSGFNGVTPVTPTVVSPVATPSWSQVTAGSDVIITGNVDAPNNSNTGTAIVTFPTARVDRVTLVYREGPTSAADPDAHAISLLGPVDFALPDLTITKTPAATNVSRGNNAVYTLTVSNVATGATAGATNGPITVTDTLPAGLTFVSGTGTNWVCTAVGQTVTCTYSGPDIPPGGSAPDITLTATVGGTALSYTNTATVTTAGDSNNANNAASSTITVLEPDLTIVKTAIGAPFTQGGTGSYTLQVTNVATGANAGPTTGAITITDTLPAGLTFVSGTGTGWTCSAVGQLVTCNYTGPALPPGGAPAGEAPPVTLTVNVGTAASYTNTSTVTTPNDSNPANDTSSVTVPTIATPPNLTLTKTAARVVDTDGSGTTTPGDVLEYTITVSNAVGAGNATGVTITDPIPANTTYVPGSLVAESISRTDAAGDDQANFTGTDAVFRLGTGADATNGGTLAGGASATAVFRVTLGAGSPPQVSNTATLSGTNFANQTETTNTPVVVVATPPNLTLTKTAARVVDTDGSGTTTPGDVLEYTITVSNAVGAGNATGVTITDPIPANTTYVPGSLVAESISRTDAAGDDQANFTGTAAVFRLGTGADDTNGGTLAGGASATAVFRVTLGAGSPPQVSNTATLSGTNFANQTETTNTPVVVVATPPNLTLTKTAARVVDTDGSGTTTPGDVLEYTITVSNAVGAGNATGVTITDPIPVNTTYVPGSLVAESISRTDAAGDDQANFTGTDAVFRLGTGADATNGGTLAGGASATAVFRVTLGAGSPPQVSNTATLSGTNFANQTQTTNTPVVVVATPPNLTLTKTAARVVDTDGSGTTTPGDVLEYTITVSNAVGAGNATGVTITDPIPANTTYVPGSLVAESISRTDAAGDDQANFTGTAAVFRLGTGADDTNGGTLAGGASATAVFRVTLGAGSPPQVSNTATLSGTNFANQTETTNTPVVVVATPPNLTLTKTAARVVDTDGSGTTTPGDVLEYTITVSNAVGAGNATGVTITDPIPVNTTYVPGSLVAESISRTDAAGDDQANFTGTAAVFRLGTGADATNGGTLAGGASATAVFRVTLGAGSPPQVSNTATLSGTNFANQTETTNTPVVVVATPPNLTLTKTAARVVDTDGSGTTTPGDVLEYTITVSNAVGAGNATGVTITDPIPANTTYVPGSLVAESISRTDAAGDDQANFTGTAAVFRLGTGADDTNGGTLAGGASATAVFRVTLGAGSPPQVSNTATLSGTNFANQTETTNTPVVVVATPPNLTLTKTAARVVDTDGSGTTTPGDVLEYTITVSNAVGAGNATGVTITDPIPVNTTYVPGSLVAESISRTDAAGDDQANFTGTDAVFRLGTGADATNGGTLAGGASATAVFRVTLGAGSPPQVSNTATLSGTNFANQTQTTNTPVVVVATPPNLTLTKTAARVVDTDGSGTTTPGDVLEYTITVSNAVGAGNATGVTITDPIPANTTYVPGSLVAESISRTDAAGDDQANFTGTAAVFRLGTGADDTNGGTLAGGASATAVFRVTLGAGSPPQVSNTATLSGTNFANQTETTNTPVVVVATPPNLTLTKTAARVVDTDGSGTTTPGDVLEYTITVSNAVGAGNATGVTITDPIPVNTTYVPGSLVAESISRTDAAGDDQANFTGTAAVFRLGTGADDTNGGTLAGGASATAVFRVTLGAGSPPQVSNTATLSGTNFANQTETTNTPVVVVATPPNLTLTKTAARVVDTDGSGTTTPGDVLEYTITVSNAVGAGNATGVTITDPIPANTTYVPGSLVAESISRTDAAGDDQANFTGTAAVFRLGTGADDTNGGTLAGGASATAVFRVTLGAGSPPQVSNTATLSGTNFANQTQTTNTPVAAPAPPPNISITKTATRVVDADGSGTTTVGDTLEYSITVTNAAGAGIATGVVVTDPIPVNTTYVPGSLVAESISRTDALGDDQANFTGTDVVFRLGTGANATNGGTLAGGASATAVFRVVLGAGANPNVTNTATVNGTNFTPQNAPTTTPVGVTVGGTPNVLLVKRLTRINTTDITGFVDAPGVEDNNPNWPAPAATYLRGAITNTVQPGDELEYTIYFLSTGTRPATNVRICDVLDPNLEFLPISFNGLPGDGGLAADQGIALALSSTTLPTSPTNGLTNISDTPDRGQFLLPGTAIPANCNSTAANTSGVVVVDVVRSPATLPSATAPGTPTNSYGFIRLRARVK